MNRRKFQTIAAVLSLTADSRGFAQGAPTDPIYKTIPFLRGVNFTGLSDQPGGQAPPASAVDYYIRQKKMNVVRLNFPWEMVQSVLGGTLDSAQVQVLDDQVKRITDAGAYVILEFHNYGRRRVNGTEYIIGENPAVSSSDFADAWGKVASRWKSNNRVIYALMNEPHDQDTRTLINVSNRALRAIREAGVQTLVMVSANNWNSTGWLEGSENQKLMHLISDPADNFCFDVHQYFDSWSRGQSPNVIDDPIKPMRAFLAWAKRNRKRAFCGEFGAYVNSRGLSSTAELLELMESNKDVFIGWAWWGGGGPWQPDYIFLLDPYASATSSINPDPVGAQTWSAPVDRPQMALLQRYLPNTASRFNAWLIENEMKDSLVASLRCGDILEPGKSFWPSSSPRGMAWMDSGPRKNHGFWTGRPGKPEEDGSLSVTQSSGTFSIEKANYKSKFFAIYALMSDEETPADEKQILLSMREGDRESASDYVLSTGISKSGRQPPDVSIAVAFDNQNTHIKYRYIQHYGELVRSTVSDSTKKSETTTIRVGTNKAPINARIYDLIILDRHPSKNESDCIQGRLFWDHGLAHTLPNTHPYRHRAPEAIGS